MIELPVIKSRPARRLSKDAAEFLRLMADPTRSRIFLHLMAGETCNCEMADVLDLPQNLISHHLLQLHRSGLILAQRDTSDRRWIYYTVNREALARIHQELGTMFDPARTGHRTPQCGPKNGHR